MPKSIFLAALNLIAAALGPVVTKWMQGDVSMSSMTPTQLLGAVWALVVIWTFIAYLEFAPLPLTWWWHRFWYLRDIDRGLTTELRTSGVLAGDTESDGKIQLARRGRQGIARK